MKYNIETIKTKTMKVSLKQFLKKELGSKKYYYLTLDFFRENLSMDFKYYNITDDEIKDINKKGCNEIEDYTFEIIETGNRYNLNLNLKNQRKDKDKGFKYCLEEFFLFLFISDQKKKKIQKVNFLITYIKYIMEFESLDFLVVENFTKDTEDFSEKKENKLAQNLYINNRYEDKVSFIYDSKLFINEIIRKTSTTEKNKLIFYRGQSDSSWDVSPSISRSEKLKHYEDELYYDVLSLKPNEFKNDSSIYEKLITMQHFGLPTRLVDLSRNPLIGLYFACEENLERDGALYSFAPKREEVLNFSSPKIKCFENLVKNKFHKKCDNCSYKIESDGKCKSSEVINFSYFTRGIANNSRIDSQSGDFIFAGINKGKNTKCIDDVSDLATQIFILDRSVKKDIMEDLKLLNIHSGTVYPDLSNMALHLKSEINSREIEISNPVRVDDFEIYKEEILKLKYKMSSLDKIRDYIENNELEEFRTIMRSQYLKNLISLKGENLLFVKEFTSNKDKSERLFRKVTEDLFYEYKK